MNKVLIIDGTDDHRKVYDDCVKPRDMTIVPTLEAARNALNSDGDFQTVLIIWHAAVHSADGEIGSIASHGRKNRSCILIGAEWRSRQSAFANIVAEVLDVPVNQRLLNKALQLADANCIYGKLRSQMPGSSASWSKVLREASLAAVSDLHVLITGESGTGKPRLRKRFTRTVSSVPVVSAILFLFRLEN